MALAIPELMALKKIPMVHQQKCTYFEDSHSISVHEIVLVLYNSQRSAYVQLVSTKMKEDNDRHNECMVN